MRLRSRQADLTRHEALNAIVSVPVVASSWQDWIPGSGDGMVAATADRGEERRSPLDITRAGSRPSGKGSSDWFSGTVRIDPLCNAHAAERVQGASVTFEPGARTAWHTHPLGQTLIVTAGLGRVQSWGGPLLEIPPRHVGWFPPGDQHWHGP